MRKPSSADLMAILISLLADQEGVEITYELEEKNDVRRVSQGPV
jgi:hypothetical protein